MKKILLLAVIAMSMLAFSCTSFSLMIRPPVFVAVSQTPRNISPVTISVQPSWENFGPGNSHGKAYGTKRISSFSVTIRNNTDSTVRIFWNKSTLQYNGGSYYPFIEGQNYGNSYSSMGPMVIPPYGTMRKTVFSSQQAFNKPGKHDVWEMRPIETDNAVLVFFVQSNDFEDYYSIAVR